MKLLLHTCCGPCFLGVWEDLSLKDFEVTNYFYNPNIQPGDEYTRRLENLGRAIEGKTSCLVVEHYDKNEHIEAIKGLKKAFPERCTECYRLRLTRTAEYAKKNGFDAFSTTLLISPYQQHEVIKQLSKEISEQFKIDFYYSDWRKSFRAGQKKAKDLNIYRQKYCGCIYSRAEAAKE